MENASDALKIAFALIVFTTAIATLFILTTNTRSTADTIFEYMDDTIYEEHLKSEDVGVSEIVGTLYRYYKESICVIIKFKNGEIYTFDRGNENYKEVMPLNSAKNIELNLDKFVNEKLLDVSHVNQPFTVSFVEIPRTGMYAYDEDSNTDFTLKSGSKKVFITYEEK